MGMFDMLEAQAEARASFVPTPEQEDILEAVRNLPRGGALGIQAKAGTGKTTTEKQALHQRQRPGELGKARLLAFNSKIAREWQDLGADALEASTFHALACRHYPLAAKEAYLKIWKAARAQTRDRKMHAPMVKAADMGKNIGIGLPGGPSDTLESWLSVLKAFGIRYAKRYEPEAVAYAAQQLFRSTIADSETGWDFNDAIYLLARDGFTQRVDPVDWLLVDEFQDLNHPQFLILDHIRALGDGGCRLIFAGDENQAIYGWRGAGTRSFQDGVERYDAQVLPLSVSQRCSVRVILEAQKIVPGILPKPDAPEGFVITVRGEDLQTDWIEDGQAVLCRNNAPLLRLALRFLREGRSVFLQGRDVPGKAKKTWQRVFNWGRHRHDTIAPFANAKIKAEAEYSDRPAALSAAIEDIDVAEALWEILQERPGVDPKVWRDFQAFLEFSSAALNEMFFEPGSGDTSTGITMSSIHRAKGLEWETVWYYMPELIPSRSAKMLGGWHLEQESNLDYVARTRAIENLGYISGSATEDS